MRLIWFLMINCIEKVIDNNVIISTSLNEEIIHLYNSDLTLEQIAEKLSIGKTTLHNKIIEIGLKRDPRLKRKEISKEEILSLEDKGYTYREIAQKLNIHPSNLLIKRKQLGIYNPPQKAVEQQAKALKVRTENKKAGIKPENKHKYNCLEIYLDEILDLLHSGISKTEIARRYNVNPQTVHNLLALYEIKIPVFKKLDGKENTIKRLFNQGLSVQEIAKKLCCSTTIVISKIKELGLSRSISDVKINSRLAKEERQIRKMYKQGCSLQEIGDKVNAHPVWIGAKIRKMGLTRANKHAEYKTKLFGLDKEIIKMRKKGMTYKEIGQVYGVSPNTVINHLRKLENKRSHNA